MGWDKWDSWWNGGLICGGGYGGLVYAIGIHTLKGGLNEGVIYSSGFMGDS